MEYVTISIILRISSVNRFILDDIQALDINLYNCIYVIYIYIYIYIPPNVLTGCPGLLGTGRGAEAILPPKALPGPPSKGLRGFRGVLGTLLSACQSLQSALRAVLLASWGSFGPSWTDSRSIWGSPKCLAHRQGRVAEYFCRN